MAVRDVQSVFAKWQRNSSAAAQDYAAGVANTDKDPTALAIAAGQRYIQRVTESFNSGKWANGLRRSGKQGWQAAVATKGASNYATGVGNAQAKFEASFGPLLAYVGSLQSRIAQMPNVTDQDRENRMIQWVRGMRDYKKS